MINIGKEMGTVDVDWLKTEYLAFGQARTRLQQGFDMILDNTWFGYSYRLLGSNPEADILHTHHGELNWPAYGSQEYPDFLQNAKFNLVAISNFMKRVYKHGVLQGKDGKPYGPLNFDSHVVAYYRIDIDQCKSKNAKGDRLPSAGRFDDFNKPKNAMQVDCRLMTP